MDRLTFTADDARRFAAALRKRAESAAPKERAEQRRAIAVSLREAIGESMGRTVRLPLDPRPLEVRFSDSKLQSELHRVAEYFSALIDEANGRMARRADVVFTLPA